MKRSAPTTAARTPSSLQQPVSCRLCRTRKLKCDREHPCFNCSSRNVACVYASGSPSQPADMEEQQHVQHSCERDCAPLARRIRRLEAAVFPADAPDIVTYGSPRGPILAAGIEETSPQRNKNEEQQRTSRWLEGLLVDPDAQTQDPKSVGVASAKFQSEKETMQPTSSSAVDISAVLNHFPTQSVAEEILERHFKTVNAIYRILHIPTTRRLLRELYVDLNAHRIPSATRLGFFLAIFSAGAYLSNEHLLPESATLGAGHMPAAPAELWFGYAVSLLTRPPVPPSTLAMQAYTSLVHLCTQIEGISERFTILLAFCVQMARRMKLHILDTPRSREERQRNGADMVDVEIKRRVWWHLVSSDWFLANLSGPYEGTYLFHPRQMETYLPSNVEDDVIPTGITHISEEVYNLPASTPTSISYFLFRIQAAALSREVVDLLPPRYFTSPGTVDNSDDEIYDTILLLDRNYQNLQRSLPPFFQLNLGQYKDSYDVLVQEKPYLEWQRHLVNFVIHTQIVRLHRPFLIRGSMEPKFAYSRMQCIRSAEIVLEIRNSVIQETEPGLETNGEGGAIGGFLYMLHHFLMAAVVLAMEVCFNPDEIRVEQRKQDVLRACRVLEGKLREKLAGGSSRGWMTVRSLQRAVHSLREVLKRHIDKDRGGGTTTATTTTTTINNNVEVAVDDNDNGDRDHDYNTSRVETETKTRTKAPGPAANVREKRTRQKQPQQRQRLGHDFSPPPPPLSRGNANLVGHGVPSPLTPTLPPQSSSLVAAPSLPVAPTPPYYDYTHNHDLNQLQRNERIQIQTQTQEQYVQTTGHQDASQVEEEEEDEDEDEEAEEPTLDALWDEFFTVAPTFNESDWDTFLIDLDEKMGT